MGYFLDKGINMDVQIFKGFTHSNKDREVLEYYTSNGTYTFVQNYLSQVPEEGFYNSALYYTDDLRINMLIKHIESVLLDIKFNHLSMSNLIKRFWEIKELIDKDQLYIELNYLVYLIFVRVKIDSGKSGLYAVCMSLLLDLALYVYGRFTPLYIDEGRLMVDESNYSALNYKEYRTLRNADVHNFSLEQVTEIHHRALNAETVFRSRIMMSNFLQKEDIVFWRNTLVGAHQILLVLDAWKENEYLKNCLTNRCRLLPKAGITLNIKHLGGYEKIFLKERFYREGKVIITFALSNVDGKDICGFYDLLNQVLYSCLSDCNVIGVDSVGKEPSQNVENFVLQTYLFLASDIKPKNNRLKAVKIYENESDFKQKSYPSQICLIKAEDQRFRRACFVEVKGDSGIDREAVMRQIDPYMRKLPSGYVASDEAIANAKTYGYELMSGYTFVTGFEKSVWCVKR